MLPTTTKILGRPAYQVYILVILLVAALALAAQLLVSYIFSIWDKARVESVLSTSFKRKVNLGKIEWHLDLRGIAFDTTEITIADKDSTQFFHANKTTILFGIIPLLHGKLRIKHLNMQQPRVWLKRLSTTEWNFSDLPQSDVFSKFADCKVSAGNLFLIDKRTSRQLPYPAAYPTAELKHIQFETHRPFGKLFWPFILSAQINQSEGLCRISLKGYGRGSLNEWQNCHYSFTLIANHFALTRLASFVDSVPQTEGTIDLELKGEGTPADHFNGLTKIKTDRFVIKQPNIEPFKLSHASVQAEVILNKKLISWKDFTLKIGESILKSEGKIDQWLSASPNYQAKFDSNIEELYRVLKNIDYPSTTPKLASLPQDLAFSGKFDLAGSMIGKFPNNQFTIEIAFHNARLELKTINFVLSTINGSIRSDKDGLHIKQATGSLNRGNVQASADIPRGKGNVLSAKGNSIAIEDIKRLASILHVPSILDNINVHGNLKTIDIFINNNTKQPKLSFTANPDGVILEGQNHNQILKITDGLIIRNDNNVELRKLKGTFGSGDFFADGHINLSANASSNITLIGNHLDLANANMLMQSLGIKNSISSLFSGKIKVLQLHIVRANQKQQITLNLSPDDIQYTPIDSSQAIHVVNGMINYDNDNLTVSNAIVKGPISHCTLNTKILNFTTQSEVKEIHFNNAVIDLKEISNFMTASKNPLILRQSFKKFLDGYGISDLQGQLTGDLFLENINNVAKLRTNSAFNSVQFKRSGQIICLKTGALSTNHNSDLYLHNIDCSVNNSTFKIDGNLKDFHNLESLRPQLKIKGQIYYADIAPFLSAPAAAFSSNKPILFQAYLSNYNQINRLNFSAKVEDKTQASLSIGNFIYKKPVNQAITVSGLMTVQGSTLSLGTSKITIGQLPFYTAGTITGIFDNVPSIDIKAWIHDPAPLQNIFDVINQGQVNTALTETSGTLRGGTHIRGSLDNPTVTAGCRIAAGAQPKFGLSNVDGHLKMTFVQDNKNLNIKNPNIVFQFDRVMLEHLPIKDLSGSATYLLNDSPTSISLTIVKGTIAGGTLTGSAQLDLSDKLPFHTNIQLTTLDSNELTKELSGQANELTGKVNLVLTLDGNGSSWQELIKSLSGSGNFEATNGRIDKLKQLQVKLEEANLLEQGIVGFRPSNVLGILEPQENGVFLSTSGQFHIVNGIVSLQNIVFDGEELKLHSSGTLNLNTQQITLHINGDIAHIGEEGTVGKIASLTSAEGLADLVSKELRFKRKFVSSHPFVFDVDGYLNQSSTISNSIAKSIAKSFHWTKISASHN